MELPFWEASLGGLGGESAVTPQIVMLAKCRHTSLSHHYTAGENGKKGFKMWDEHTYDLNVLLLAGKVDAFQTSHGCSHFIDAQVE